MQLRDLLVGGDRRSIARGPEALNIALADPNAVEELARLATDADPLVAARACDVLEKLAGERKAWVAPYKRLFVEAMDHPHWEARLQCVRAVALFTWTESEREELLQALRTRIDDNKKFVRCWPLDSFALLTAGRAEFRHELDDRLAEFLGSGIPSMQARARSIVRRIGRAE